MTNRGEDRRHGVAEGTDRELHCSFCNKAQPQVKKLIAGPAAYICDECVDICVDIVCEERKPPDSLSGEISTPRDMFDRLRDYVAGQDDVLRAVAGALYRHLRRARLPANRRDAHPKENILLVGPTGSGKSFIIEKLHALLGVPLAVFNSVLLTAPGYAGDDVEAALVELLRGVDYDLTRAQQGILYLDRIDKLSRVPCGEGIAGKVMGGRVQQTLISLMDGTVARLDRAAALLYEGSTTYEPGSRSVRATFGPPFDTADLLFICGGVFEGIEETVRDRLSKENGSAGSGSGLEASAAEEGQIHTLVTAVDLIEYGLAPELVARFSRILPLRRPCRDELAQAFLDVKDSIHEQYETLLSSYGVKLIVTEDAVAEIADTAYRAGLGAHGLSHVMERALADVLFELPERDDIRSCVLDGPIVSSGAPPRLLDGDGAQVHLDRP